MTPENEIAEGFYTASATSSRTAKSPRAVVRWRYRPAAGTRYVPDLSSAAAARRRAAAPAHCMRWPRPGERLHYPDCESLLLNEVPEVVVVDHPSPPDKRRS